MTFLVFEQFADEGRQALRPTGDGFKLAGRNLLYQAWVKLGRPLERGWHISRTDLLDLYFRDGFRPQDPHLIIDFHPGASGRIGLVEPMDIYAYTFADGEKARWTPLMLRLHDVFYEEYEEALTEDDRRQIMERIPFDPPGEESVEFLYLRGEDRGWNWGRNGMTNAAFLQGRARDYFRRFF